ncbi:MAG TPA: AI-2E family transporter [Longimicrobium sp.]|jgi:predicted PurR-regulated permease PerM|uniref:AI-2E family transporter n=1 Tax=Longimicrobium sp. TaxID=2029185 RepID=UPI002ED9008E
MAEDKTPTPMARGPVPADAVARHSSGPMGQVRPEHLYRAVLLGFLLALLYRYFDPLTRVFLMVYAAAIIAIGLNGLRALIPVQRKWMAAGVGVVVIGGLVALLAWGTPLLVGQVKDLASQGPAMEQQITQWEEWLHTQMGMQVNIPSPSQLFSGGGGGGEGGAAKVMGQAASLLEILFVPLVLFFGALFALASPNDHLLTPMMRAFPEGLRLAWYRIFQLLGERIMGWLKGVGTAMVGVGALSVVAFYLIGVPNALLLGLLNGLLEFIPLAGPWIGGLSATMVAFLVDPTKGMWTAIAALAIQQIEANIITPWAMSHNAEIHPFVTLFALVLFGSLFGFLGVLLALPLVLLVWTMVQVLWVERAIDTDRERIQPVVPE